MYTAMQIANFFIRKAKEENIKLDPMKLQKLLYYAYGWHYVNFNRPLFTDTIQAWKFGPVIEDIYHVYKKYGNENIPGFLSNAAIKKLDSVNEKDAETVNFLNEFWDKYKNYSGIYLSRTSHMSGSPWEQTYNPESYYNSISPALIKDYFNAIDEAEDNEN